MGPGIRKHAPIATLVAALLGVASTTAIAADWPVFKPGQWQFNRTMEGMGPTPQTVSRTDCVDPTANQKKQQDMLARSGCQFTAVTQQGTTYRYSATCKVAGMTTKSDSVLKVTSAESYTLTVDSTTDGQKTHEVLVARRVGECKP